MLDRLAQINTLLPSLALVAGLLLAAVIAHFVVRRALISLMHLLTSRSSTQWDDALLRNRVFHRLTHIIPAIVLYWGIALISGILVENEFDTVLVGDQIVLVVRNVVMAYVALMVTLAVSAALNAGNEIYETHAIARERPLKGIIQVAQIVVFVFGGVVIVSHLIDKSPLVLLSGFGAMTAVLLLVFKDTILGFVASLQLTANDMVRVGDWIEMPSHGADGDVIEVALHTVKVQNWDKTISTIPTYQLIAESFKNWRGMAESGGRRIKRALNIDQRSVRFLKAEEIESLSRFALLREHFARKARELEEAAAAQGDDARDEVNRRRLTNAGVFRAYIRNYLAAHPRLNHEMTTLVRQLDPGPEGLPIEVYCFTNTTAWLEYEDIQSDIFDHLLAILPEFDLRLFQNPSGADFSGLSRPNQAV